MDKIQPWNPSLMVQNESMIPLPRGSDSTKDKMELFQKACVRKTKWNVCHRIPRVRSSRSQPRKGVRRPQSQNQMPTTWGYKWLLSLPAEVSAEYRPTNCSSATPNSTLRWQSTGCMKCTHMHKHTLRSSTSTKDFPLDNFEEAMQVFLLLGKRRILCSLVLKSHLRETLTWTRVLRTGCHAGERYSVIYFPWSFTYTLDFKREILKHYCFEINEYTFQTCITSISYLLASLHKREGIKFSIYGDRELHKGWVICQGLQVNRCSGQNKVPWLRGTCCQHKAMPPSSCAPWSQA